MRYGLHITYFTKSLYWDCSRRTQALVITQAAAWRCSGKFGLFGAKSAELDLTRTKFPDTRTKFGAKHGVGGTRTRFSRLPHVSGI